MVLTLHLAVMAQDNTGPECISIAGLQKYKTLSDKQVKLFFKKKSYSMTLSSGCNNLHYHGYLSYIPLNGKLCTQKNEIKTRSGHSCLVQAFLPIVQKK